MLKTNTLEVLLQVKLIGEDGIAGEERSKIQFTCIDFETANRHGESACAVGIAVYNQGELVESKNWLVRPHEDYCSFEWMNIRIHGINKDKVADCLEFDQIYEEIIQYLQPPLVAHNASFDMGVLRKLLTLYDIPWPEINYICTLKIARKTWLELGKYSLDYLSDYLNHTFDHHDAQEDAIACDNVLNCAMQELGVESVSELLAKLGLEFQSLTMASKLVPGSERNDVSEFPGELKGLPSRADSEQLKKGFRGKKVIFTGSLQCMTRNEAIERLSKLGGRSGRQVTKDTDFLVMGKQQYSRFADGKESNNTKRAKELIQSNQTIKIINEAEFLKLLLLNEEHWF